MSRAQQLLIRCVEKGDGSGVEEAVEAGASVDWVERGGRAALHDAAASANSEMVHLLLAYSANPDIRSMARGEEGATPLHLAACVGNTTVMKLLLDGGAAVEAVDQRGKTAVHWAALQGKMESLKVLQDYNCDLEALVNGRGTALHYAAAFGDFEVVEWLVERGVDVAGKDKNGRLAKDVAKRNGHKHVHNFLKQEAKTQPRKSTSRARNQYHTDQSNLPVPKPRRRTLRDKKLDAGEATRDSPQDSNSPNPPKKKGWVPIRSMSVGNKTGLRQQLEAMKREMDDMEKAIRTKDVQIARLQGDIFATELEKVRVEEQLNEMRTYSGRWQRSTEHQDQKGESDAAVPAILEAPSQDGTTLLLELERVKTQLKKEQHARESERYASNLKITSLITELNDATQKLRKYGVRQKKLLSKNKTFELDLTTAGAPSGLPDLGDAGAVNSIVQCLYGVTDLRDYLTTDAFRQDVVSRGEVVEALAGVFKALKAGVQPEILAKVHRLKEVVDSLAEAPRDGRVPDAHDLLILLLPWLHHDLCQVDGTSVVSNLFLGSQEHSVTCRWTGGDVSRVAEDFSTIYLDVTSERETSLKSLLADHYKPLSTEYDCPHCLRSHLCRKQLIVTRLPPILIIHLARKNKGVNVTFPPSHFTLHDVLGCDGPSFELFGIVTLQGTTNSPRYTAFCKNPSDPTWRLYDNEKVCDVNSRTSLDQPNAHILFYSAEVN